MHRSAILGGGVLGSSFAVELDPDGSARRLSPSVPAGSGITIETLSYSEQGDVEISGGTVAEAPVVVAIDGGDARSGAAEAVTVLAGRDGRWSVVVPGSLLELETALPDPRGRDLGRWIRRGSFNAIQAQSRAIRVSRKVLSSCSPETTCGSLPGTSMAAGIRYHWIFQANSDQIDDPDLIFPGQVFIVPEGEPAPQ